MFRSIGHRMLALVGAVAALGLIALTLFYAERHEQAILGQNERTLVKVTDSITQALRTVMLAGYADIGQEFGDHLKGVADVADLRILRPDGREAFRDNRTINEVNATLSSDRFRPRFNPSAAAEVLAGDSPLLLRAVETGAIVTYYERGDDGHLLFTILAPVTSQEACKGCHADDAPVRGLLKLTTSLAHLEDDIRAGWVRSWAVLAAALAAMMAVVGVVVRRTVLKPIKAVTRAMERAGGGDLSQEAPVMGQDELARMAVSFNSMAHELSRMWSGLRHEQNKLSTILLGARDGIVVTDGDGDVVLVNPAAERLLGKSEDAIKAAGFLAILDDPEWARAKLQLPIDQQQPEKIVYGGRTLSVHMASIRSETGQPVGSAALMRDITEETRLREELERLSVTDGLTGLYNRRYFDQKLSEELLAAVRYNRPISVLLFDVDHFKRFNDTYGHDMGDRVLVAIAAVLRSLRLMDIPCRYGGEEFAVILPNTPQDKGLLAAERLRKAIEDMRVDDLTVTVSIGLAARPPLLVTQRDELVRLADQALYASKQGGRNRVTVATPAAPT